MVENLSLKRIVLSFILSLFVLFQSPGMVLAAAVAVTGRAKVLNTNNSYLDFTNYSSNVALDDVTGNFSGYAFLEDAGWVVFGSTDNPLGPVDLVLATGKVAGKAYVLNTGSYLDFTGYNSNVMMNLVSGIFSGYVFSEDMGWINFSDPGVQAAVTNISDPFNLDSPCENCYINSERPAFKWRGVADSVSLANYILEVDNGETGDFLIDNIPVSGTVDNETNKYLVHFENFSDSDNTNDYISIHTKSSLEWSLEDNDGKLKEGRRAWQVKAKDTVGGERTKVWTLFVDRTTPSLEITRVNNRAFASNLATADTTPTITGKLTDTLAGDRTENKVASGPKNVEIKIEKRNLVGIYDLHSLATVNMTESYWSNTGEKITDNTQNTAGKYANFSFTPANSLPLGTYKLTLTGTDNAGNSSSISFNLNVTTFEGIITPEEEKEEVIEKEPERVIEVPPLPEPEAVGNLITDIVGTIADIYWSIIDGVKVTAEYVAVVWQGYTDLVYNSSQTSLAFIGSLLETVGQAVTDSYYALAQRAPGVVGRVMLAVSNALRTSADAVASVFRSAASAIAAVTRPARTALGNFAYRWQVKLASIAEILFDKNPTVITNVEIAEVGRDYAVITWETNHYTKNNKVNYGESLSYGEEMIFQERARYHEFKITGLEPNKKYFFEVMSQNKNYVYDSYYEFTTLPE